MTARILKLGQTEPIMQPVGDTAAEFLGLSDRSREFYRQRLIARAYSMLPDLTEDERRMARDKTLARECALWRGRFRELNEDLERQRQSYRALEQRHDALRAKWLAAASVEDLSAELKAERDRGDFLEQQLGNLTFRMDRLLSELSEPATESPVASA